MTATATKPTLKASLEANVSNPGNDLFEPVRKFDHFLLGLDPNSPAIHPRDCSLCRDHGLDPSDLVAVKGQIVRARRMQQHSIAAGTNAEFAKAKSVAETAAAAERKQRPEIAAQVEALQVQLNKLADATQQSQARVEGMELAREQLREVRNLPPLVNDLHNRMKRYGKAGGPRIAELENRLLHIDTIVAMQHNSVEAFAYARDSRRDLIVQPDITNPRQRVDAGKWAQFQSELKNERPKVEAELKPLKAEFAQNLAEADRVRDFYIAQL